MTGCRDWLNTQDDASFKGVRFEVDSESQESGRRIAIHEYPTREFWDNEDLGRKPHIVQVTGYVHGDQADTEAGKLLRACTSPGVGLLTLPLRSSVQARCLNIRSNFEKTELGRFYFDMEFVLEARSVGGVVSSVLLSSAVDEAIDAAQLILGDSFASQFNTVDAPGVVRESAADTIKLLAETLEQSRKSLRYTDSDAFEKAEISIRRLKGSARDFAYQGQSASRIESEVFIDDQLTIDPGLHKEIEKAFKNLGKAATDIRERSLMFANLVSFSGQKLVTSVGSESAALEKLMVGKIVQFTKQNSLLSWARSATKTKYTSKPEPVTVKADIVTAFEKEIEETIDDEEAVAALQAVKLATVNFLANIASELPTIWNIELPRPMPAVVLSYRLYGDINNTRDIVERNKAEHPLFLPAELKVLRPAA